MPVISCDFGVYVPGRNDSLEPAAPKEVSIEGESLYKYDAESGILEVSLDAAGIEALVAAFGPFPIKRLALPAPYGHLFFLDVTDIRSLPHKDGGFLLEIVKQAEQPPQPEAACEKAPRKSLLRRFFDRS